MIRWNVYYEIEIEIALINNYRLREVVVESMGMIQLLVLLCICVTNDVNIGVNNLILINYDKSGVCYMENIIDIDGLDFYGVNIGFVKFIRSYRINNKRPLIYSSN